MVNPVTSTDSVFLKRFAIMIAMLAVLVVLLVVLSSCLYERNPAMPNADHEKFVAERIAPVGGVYAGDTGRAAMQAAQEAAKSAAASQVAYGGTTDGKTIYTSLCHSCHDSGVAGAPKVGDKPEWAARVAEGLETLDKHAIDGYTGKTGVMPARGGNPSLSDEQVKAAVAWMVDQSK